MVANVSNLHNWGHEDYEQAKRDIHAQLGRIDLDIFGRQVLVAVYTRPAFNYRNGMHATADAQKADWWEGKVVLILDHGPDAFTGEESYLKATYRDGIPPKKGDWVFQNANTGIQINFKGDGAVRVQYTDRHDDKHNLYPDEGWPVRIVGDDGFLGRLKSPHTVV